MKEMDAGKLRNCARSLDTALRTDETVKGHIDPGFVNRRLISTLMTSNGVSGQFEAALSTVSGNLQEWQREYAANQICTRCTLDLCRLLKAPSLVQVAQSGSFSPGVLVCSTDKFKGKRFKRGQERGQIEWRSPVRGLTGAKLQFSLRHIFSDTVRDHLQKSHTIAHVSRLVETKPDLLVLEPLVMGGPWLLSGNPEIEKKLMWHHFDYFQLFIEDIDEFSKVKDFEGDTSDWVDSMANISEEVMKTFLADLLGDQSGKDWGGEFADHFTRHLHIQGRRHTTAFLLKGPGSKHLPMTFRQLGKNGDQIFRLSKLPADLFVLQHCHEITPAVLETLRNAIVQPHRERRYLVIDGRDSYKLLQAYGKLDWALEETKKERASRKKKRRKKSD